jgi:hypothetical protein
MLEIAERVAVERKTEQREKQSHAEKVAVRDGEERSK